MFALLPAILLSSMVVAPPARPPLAFAFTPAGLLFPYYIGVAYRLSEIGILQSSSPLGGSSAGAIVAAAVACGVSEREVRRGLDMLLADVRRGMRLNLALRKVLAVILEDDCHTVARQRGLKIGYFEVLPLPGRRLVSEWSSKDDLIDTIAASCNWPLFFSRWPLVWCRNSLCIDGFFSVKRQRFGCPPLEAERTVAVTALPRVSLGAFDPADVIQPGRLPGATLPLDDAEWFRYAMAPAADNLIEEMVGLGRRHATIWADAQRRQPLADPATAS